MTTKTFLLGLLDTLRNLLDFEALEDADLLSKDSLLVGMCRPAWWRGGRG